MKPTKSFDSRVGDDTWLLSRVLMAEGGKDDHSEDRIGYLILQDDYNY